MKKRMKGEDTCVFTKVKSWLGLGGSCDAMTYENEIREAVSKAYAKAVTSPAPGGSCCGGRTATKGAVAAVAGYSEEELRSLPREAAVNAFGCGNPVAFSEMREGEVILDLGSGAGIDLLLAAKKVGPTGRVIGVDMTEEMLAKARENIRAAGVRNVEVRKGIIEDLPVDDSSVDWVISNCVINLSPEKHRVFAEIARVLKPGGKMLVSDIVVEDLPEWIRQSARLYGACIAGAISEKQYLEGLRAAGLEQVEVRERLVCDESQLAAFVRSETIENVEAACYGGTSLSKELADEVIKTIVGKVWSVRVFARKHL
jgi:ubiquinone/menaquinone biosynthesis C-methylase UbiE